MIEALESEQALIGAALFEREACAEALERVRPEHFHEPVHGLIWEELRRGGPSDPVLLARRLESHPAFGQLGGVGYLGKMLADAYTHTVPEHVEAVLDAAMRRQLQGLAKQVVADADKPGSAEALVGALERGAADIARFAEIGPRAAPVGLTALSNLEAALSGEFRGAEVGLQCLDHVTGGIKSDDVWFFGGRTSMGKSVMGLCVAKGVAQRRRGVLMFSLEMPRREVEARLIADLAHEPYAEPVKYGDILKGRLRTHEAMERARAAARELASLPMNVTDAGNLTIDDIRSQALRQVRSWEKAGIAPGVVLIDHIGLVKPVRKTDSKAADTADTVNELKGLAKQLRCPIIALVQVNRATESRTDKRPTLGDLNWSGSIEQIGDMICLLYRESYYLERSSDPSEQNRAIQVRHDLELLIHKNRAGPICTVKAWADVACNAVRDAA